MADMKLRRRPPLGHGPIAIGSTTLSVGPALARFILRGEESLATLSVRFGVEIPTAPCRAEAVGARAAVWLGPDEWLLLAPEGEEEAIGAAIGDLAGALVEVSQRQTALILEGAGAALALSGGVPLDLSAGAFPVGMATRTLFEKAEILLWRTRPERFHIEVLRSFAPYVWSMLELILKENAAAP